MSAYDNLTDGFLTGLVHGGAHMGTQPMASIKPGVAEVLTGRSNPGFGTLRETTVDRFGTSPASKVELARCATDLIVAATGVDLSGLALYSDRGGAAMVAASQHRCPEWEQLTVEPGDGVASRVLHLGGTVTLKNYALESGSSQHLIEVFAELEGGYGMLAVPIQQSGAVIGILYGGVRRPEYIGDRGRTGLHNIANLFAGTLPSAAAEPCCSDGTAVADPGSPEPHHAPLGCDLSDRERSILRLLSKGLATKEVAAAEYLAVNTVRSYIQSALWKLGANSRLQAVAIARDVGLI
jgi:LuxR family transcriptional regulator, regulator of acetate metabolism